MNVCELTGAKLDLMVAKAEGKTAWISPYGEKCYSDEDNGKYSPSTDWTQGGAIIERDDIGFFKTKRWHVVKPNEYSDCWVAGIGEPDLIGESPSYENGIHGATPLIAAMRAFVASKFGNEVSD